MMRTGCEGYRVQQVVKGATAVECSYSEAHTILSDRPLVVALVPTWVLNAKTFSLLEIIKSTGGSLEDT